MLKIYVVIFFLIFFKNSISYSQIQIKYKIDEEIITNIDILNEGKYLIFLRPSLNKLPQEEMIDRMLFAQVIETIRCYEEGVLNSIEDANIGSIFGWGFPAFKGGTLQYVNDYGVQKFLKRTIELEKSYGDRFAPPKLLIDFVDQGKTFA